MNGIRLSQCLIVKNEERNIERSLSWGRDIFCEQIVVDTGSVDGTVRIASGMGAKVSHFEWCDDFSAAKNFAIEQAGGDWIAFLDADEYMTDDDALKLPGILEALESSETASDLKSENYTKDSVFTADANRKYKAVMCPLVNLNDDGLPAGVYPLVRFFRNSPDIRYTGRIHENLCVGTDSIFLTEAVKVLHTGYGTSVFQETGKAERNIRMLREEIARRPDDMNLKGYLADALMAGFNTGTGSAGDAVEAEALYKQVLDFDDGKGGIYIEPHLKKNAYACVLSRYMEQAGMTDVSDVPGISDVPCVSGVPRGVKDNRYYEQIALRAAGEFPDDLRIKCLYAMTLNKKGDYNTAMRILQECETVIDNAGADNGFASGDAMTGISNGTVSNPIMTTRNMTLLASQMLIAAQGTGDIGTVIKYAAFLLLLDKENLSVLVPYIAVLSRSFTIKDIIGILGQTYDMTNRADLLIIARAAKDCGAVELAGTVLEMGSK